MQHANPSHATNKFRGPNRVVINTFLNLIWDGINMIQKHCLLRCLSIPEIRDGKVDCELMNDWISSLFLDAEETEQNLRQLLDNSVLLPFEDIGGRYIRLPDETYKILQLLYILNPLVLNGSGQGLTEPPEADLWHNASRVQLADNKLSELPLSPNCLGLKVLMLQSNADLTKIPSSFFVHMPLLRILDLSYTSVRELPRSFFFLEQLRELYLKGCECFMKLPPEIGNLLKLEKLDLDETQITHLPKEVQKLTNMQSLTLYFYEYRGKKNMKYSCSTIIPSGVISNLKRLKHLSIGVNPDDERWHENVQVILPEILGLAYLQTLRIYIPQLELLKLIPAHIFEVDFRFIVGCHMQRIISSIPPAVDVKFNQSDCSLKFVKGDGVPAEIKKLLRYSKALFLDRHITLKNLSEFEMKNLEQLRLCILAECKEMQTIVGGGDSNGNDDMLSHLLFLSVSHMKNLRSIWEGPTPPRSLFGMLQSLSLQSCPELMTLFSLDFLGNLSLLKELVVKDCPKLSALISRESSKRNVDTFLPKLRKLSLLYLPELTSISSGLHIGPGLKEIGFYGCPKLCSLSRNELSSQQLTVIKGEAKWWKALKDRPSDWIFSSIHEEADVMTQLGIYNDDDIDNGPGGSVGKPSLSTGAASPISNLPALSGNSMVKEQRDPVEEANSLAKKPRFRCPIGLHDLFVDAVERLVGPALAVEAEDVVAFVKMGMEERYKTLKDLGSGNFGVAKLAKDKKTGELVAIKYIERGEKIDENVQREIINHRSLRHPNVIKFKEVLLTPTHLAIVLEYAAGGALFERVYNAGRFSEDEARFFFQQLVSGVSYCHSMQICHRDLKLENTLLDGNPAPRLKICDFGFSKSALLHSQPKSTVGTPAYIAPEVLLRMEYDGKIADTWSCGVTLYVMLVGAYPFEDPKDPRDFRKTIQRILSVQYSVPKYVRVSAECRHLLSRIFVANPAKRIALPEIKQHPWFLKNLPSAIIEADRKSYEDAQKDQPSQSVEEIMRIIQEARKPGPGSKAGGQAGAGSLDSEDVEADELVDSSGEFVVAF